MTRRTLGRRGQPLGAPAVSPYPSQCACRDSCCLRLDACALCVSCLPARLPGCLPACLPARLPARLPACLPVGLPACRPRASVCGLHSSALARWITITNRTGFLVQLAAGAIAPRKLRATANPAAASSCLVPSLSRVLAPNTPSWLRACTGSRRGLISGMAHASSQDDRHGWISTKRTKRAFAGGIFTQECYRA